MKTKFRIYCGHAITGLSGEEVFGYYAKLKEKLSSIGLLVTHPLVAKNDFKNEKIISAGNYENKSPVSTNHAIKKRDQWMVRNADIILIDLTNSKRVSIGCVSELAWADILGKHTILVMDKSDIHNHAFTLEEPDIIFETLDKAVEYLQTFVDQSFE